MNDGPAPLSKKGPQVHTTGRALLSMPAHQVHALYKLRVDIFVNEQQAPFNEIDDVDAHPGTHHVLAYVHPGSDPTFPWGAPDPGSPMRLVGTARVFGPPEAQHIGRVCVASDLRGYGIAHRIMSEALEVCRARAASLDPTSQKAVVKLEAQSYLVSFYESYGFHTVGESFEMEGIQHVAMELDLDDAPAAPED